MKASEASMLVALLQAGFPRQQLTKESISMYCEMLADLDAAEAGAAVRRLIATVKFFPTIAEIRESIAELKTSAIPSADIAWQEVHKAISAVGYNRTPTFSHPAIEHAANVIGWQTLCRSENIAIERAHFLKLYADSVQREKRDAQLGQLALPKPESKAFPQSEKAQEIVKQLAEAKKVG